MEFSSPYKDGWQAHKRNVISDANPYNEYSQHYSFVQWEDGWCARFDAIEHGSELPDELENI